jgi:thioredoxin 1
MRALLLLSLPLVLIAGEPAPTVATDGLPTLLDLGSKSCIPCKQMAPILEALRTDFAGKMTVIFIDVNAGEEGGKAAQDWKIQLIPTQIFLDGQGKELARHEGFLSREDILAQWATLKVDLGQEPAAEMIRRLEPAAKDERPKDQVCSFTGRDLDPATVVTIAAPSGPIRLVSPHAWAIYHSCAADAAKLPAITTVCTAEGQEVNVEKAVFVLNADAKNHTSATAHASREAAAKMPGMVLDFPAWLAREQAARCGFCDRSVYPDEAAKVRVGGLHTYGCCAHCAMGVAARMKQDLIIEYPDNQTGETITITTQDLKIASVTPAGAVAWFGKKPGPDGKMVSAGCFHQGFFASLDNLTAWLAAHPHAIGEQISFQQSLDDKLKLNPEQIRKACKVGECK